MPLLIGKVVFKLYFNSMIKDLGDIQLVRTHRRGREGPSIPMRTHVKRCIQ
jgi:hypothetical protein